MTTLQLFTEFENFIKPKLEHRVFIDSETVLTFRSLNNAMNAYGQARNRTLVEQLTDGSFILYNRGLVNPVKLSSLDEAFKMIGDLC